MSTPEIPVILIAEDVPLNMTLMVAMLDRIIPGASIMEASNGREAIDIFERIHIDLIFMDIQMPVMDGLEATREIRRCEARLGVQKPVPIIAVTAYTLQHEREKCMLAGMSDFLAKPINKDNIQKNLIKHLGITKKEPIKPAPVVREVSFARFDLKGLVERMQVEESVLLDLASQAIDSLQSQMQTLKALIESGNREQVKKQAHSIKGTGLNLSFNQLAHMARHMEALATDDPSGMPDHCTKMAAEVAEIRKLLR